MTEVILDTSFILTCIRQKIDFFEELKMLGLKVLVPKQVITEIVGLAPSKREAEFALTLLEKIKPKEVDLFTKNVDQGLIDYVKKNKDVFIATLDRGIKKRVTNSNVVIREKKRLEVI